MRTAILALIGIASIGMCGCSANHAELHAVLLQRIEAPSDAVGGLRRGDDIATIETVIRSPQLLQPIEPTLARVVKHPRDVLASVRIREECVRSVSGATVRQPVVVTIAGADGDHLDAALREILSAVNRLYSVPVFELLPAGSALLPRDRVSAARGQADNG